MEIEGSDIHVDKKPDGVIIYAIGVPHDSGYGKACQQLPELIDVDPQLLDLSDENGEVQDCVVKECNNDNSGEETKPCQQETSEESLPGSKSEIDKDSVKSEGRRMKHHEKTQSFGRKVKTKCTVPQPFALATEKRALQGTRPNGAECENTATVDKSSHTRIPLQPSSLKQNLVSFLDQF